MSINVLFPDELSLAAREDRNSFVRKAQLYTLGHLYQDGKISAGLASEVLGCDHLSFYHLLSENGFFVIDHSPDELVEEARSSRLIATNVHSR